MDRGLWDCACPPSTRCGRQLAARRAGRPVLSHESTARVRCPMCARHADTHARCSSGPCGAGRRAPSTPCLYSTPNLSSNRGPAPSSPSFRLRLKVMRRAAVPAAGVPNPLSRHFPDRRGRSPSRSLDTALPTLKANVLWPLGGEGYGLDPPPGVRDVSGGLPGTARIHSGRSSTPRLPSVAPFEREIEGTMRVFAFRPYLPSVRRVYQPAALPYRFRTEAKGSCAGRANGIAVEALRHSPALTAPTSGPHGVAQGGAPRPVLPSRIARQQCESCPRSWRSAC